MHASMFYTICQPHGKHIRQCRQCRPLDALASSLRSAVRGALSRKGLKKDTSSLKLLGARNWLEVSRMIESKIRAYNKAHPRAPIVGSAYVLDHIKPVSKFKDTDMRLCMHYTNLQPLPEKVNMQKGATWGAADEKFWRKNIIHKKSFACIYLPQAYAER